MIPKIKIKDAIGATYTQFLSELKNSGFRGETSIRHDERLTQATDNSVYQVLPQAIVYPQNTQDLVYLTQLVSKPAFRSVILSPRGGGTGTNGQSLNVGIMVDTSRHMNAILEINVEQRWARVQAGVVKDQLNAAIEQHGLFFAPELSTSNRATIGGMISTDASGQGSCSYGKTRDHVLELQTVLMDGSVLSSSSLRDDEFDSLCHNQDRGGLIHRVVNDVFQQNRDTIKAIFPTLNRCLTGYDLAHIRDENKRFNLNNILCGSEGTLGFISEAKINLLSKPKHVALVVVKYSDFDSSLRDANSIMKAAPTSIETIDSTVLKLAIDDYIWHKVKHFFPDHGAAAVQGINLVEYTSDSEQDLKNKIGKLTKDIERSLKKGSSKRLGYAVAWGEKEVNLLWAMRKRAVGLLGNAKGEARPIAFVEDTAVPPEKLADFIAEFRAILDAHQLQYGMFGHVDAGVLHVRPALDMKDPAQQQLAWQISDQVADLAQKYGGLLWGEHGKGVRSAYGPQFFGELYPQLQRIKAAFDPHNQLNPGKIATPSADHQLLQINEVTTRGTRDSTIAKSTWKAFDSAVYCNGNGACYNWDTADAMCPSWKATRERVHSPKGRATLLKEWLTLLAERGVNAEKLLQYPPSSLKDLLRWPQKYWRSLRRDDDFSHQVYDAMAGCLACKSCTGQCPIKVDVPTFRSQFLAIYHQRYTRPLKDHLVASLEFALPFYSRVSWLYNFFVSNTVSQKLIATLTGFVDGPRLTGFVPEDKGIAIASTHTLTKMDAATRSKTVILVQDAFTRYFETQLVVDTAQLLRALGYNPMLAPYLPNGKPLHVHGMLTRFAAVAKKNAAMLKELSDHGVPLVGIDPSIVLSYKSEYRQYLPEHDCPTVQLLQAWLASDVHNVPLPPSSKNKQCITYRLLPHCTEKTNASDSLAQWQTVFHYFGHRLDIVAVGCCGMAGTYGHEQRNLANAKKIYTLSWQEPVETWLPSGNLVATGYSCRSQIKRFNNYTIHHPVQALLNVIQGR